MRKTILAGVLAMMGAGLSWPAMAICPHTKVTDLSATCLDKSCPPGLQAYWATIVNRYPYKLYITYAFRSGKRQKQIIPGGLELQPNSEISQPIGIGRTLLPEEPHKRRVGRLRILECGVDPKIKYKWRRR
jgi:hypothetical protein